MIIDTDGEISKFPDLRLIKIKSKSRSRRQEVLQKEGLFFFFKEKRAIMKK